MVLDWITERGSALNLHLLRNVKTNCGFHHPVTGQLLYSTGLNWEDKELSSLYALLIRHDLPRSNQGAKEAFKWQNNGLW